MESIAAARAVPAAIGIARSVGLAENAATVLHDANALTLLLTPVRVVARVTPEDRHDAQVVELDRACRFLEAGCPVGVPEPSLVPLVHTRDGFAVTFWTFYEASNVDVPPATYASALVRLHAGLRTLDLVSPAYTDRIAEAVRVADEPELSPDLAAADRVLLATTLRRLRRSIEARISREQLLHGEPHPGNVLATASGPRFIDFETVCRGPVEFDLAYAPEAVGQHYLGVDLELLADCRQLVLAMLAAWRWRIGDDFPDGEAWRRRFIDALRAGPPWPTLEALTAAAAADGDRTATGRSDEVISG